MERVEHKVLAWWPEFNNGPVGRMDYFLSYLGLIGVSFVSVLVATVLVESAGDIGAVLGGLIYFGLAIWIIAHTFALIYKRFWDVGFEDAGSRAGMTIGYTIVSFVPFLSLITGLMLMFWPRKEEKVEVEA